jgi:hypothetical protein
MSDKKMYLTHSLIQYSKKKMQLKVIGTLSILEMKDVSNELLTNYVALSKEDLVDRTKTFDMFRKAYRKNEAMEENRTLLKEKYAMGK